jgi:hypothetical protein
MEGYFYNPKTGRYEYGENSRTTPQLSYEDTTDLSAVGGIENTPEQVPGRGPASIEKNETAAAGMAMDAAKEDSALGMLGGGLGAAGMLGVGAKAGAANPYLLGAGLGISALSSIQKGKNQREQQKYQAELEKYNQRQQAIARMAQISQGLKA